MRILVIWLVFVAVKPNAISYSFTFPNIHLQNIFNFLKNKAEDILEKSGGNTQCASDLRSLVHDLIFRERWALMMVDASGKLPSGLLHGNYHVVGNFDECINIREVKDHNVIDGQYCTVALMPSSDISSEFTFLLDSIELTNYLGINMTYHAADIIKMIKMTYGVCIPKSCTMGHLQKIWDYVEHTFVLPVHVHFFNILCIHKDQPVEPYDIDKYIYTAFGVYIMILLASTWYDVMIYQYMEEEHKQKQVSNYLRVFSLYTNAKKLFYYSKNSNDDHLECINGIRVLSMLWIIFGHRILVNVFSGNVNGFYVFEWKKNLENTFIVGAFLAVDTFFLLSGLLVSYVYLKYKSVFGNGKGIPLTTFYTFRILRLSPSLLATVLFYISVFKTLSDGPAWPAVAKKFAATCRYNWWATLFFFTNYFDIQYQCIEQSWYLAVDTQLYIISPIILFNLEKRPWKTCLACLGLCVVSGIYAFIITIRNNYTAFYYEGNSAYQLYIYTPTFVRMPPWLLGIIFGYLIFKYKQISIPWGTNLFMWFASLSLMTYIIMIHAVLMRNDYDAVSAATYNSCVRPAWALAVAVMIFSCVSGHGGVISKFLSLPVFQVMVRLSYSMYLVHTIILAYFIGSRRTPHYFSNIKSVHDFMGDMFFIFVVSIVWTLAFESPFLAITKIMFNKVSGTEVVLSKGQNINYEVCVDSYDKEKDLKKIK